MVSSLSSTMLAAILLMLQIGKTTQYEPFCVTRSSNINGPSPVIDFDAECFEPGEEASGFDLITDTFSPPYTGLYWLHFTAGLPNDYLTDVQLALPTRTVNIQRSAGGLVAVSSRSDIVELTAGVDRLQLSSADTLFSNVSSAQVSWSGFHLDSTMSNVAAFSVAMSPGTFAVPGYIPFDVVFVDTHSGWNYDHYTIPVTGLWVMSLHIGSHSEEDFTVTHLDLTPSEYEGFGIISGYPGGTDMNSITVVVKGNAGAILTASLADSTYSVYSDINYQTAVMGFLYSPTVQPAVAWTVALDTFDHQYGYKDPARFGTVLVNEGNGFDVGTSRFYAPLSGLYYVSMTGTAYHGADMKMDLLFNAITASVYYDENISSEIEYTETQSRSRAIILRLSVGDNLRVRIPTGYEIFAWADVNERTVFTGFRISP